MTPSKADHGEIQAFIEQHPAWRLENNKLHREYIFRNFIEAFGFMTEIALLAESMNHHPEWLNVYQKLTIDLSTHKAGGITQLDFQLAQKMEQLALNRICQ